MRKALPFALAALVLCAAAPAPAGPKLRVETTVFPLREFAAAIAGDRAEVVDLLPPGAGVHTWQPRPGDIVRLNSADLLIAVGAGLEPWLSSLLGAVPKGRLRVLEVSPGLPLLKAEDEDLHDGTGKGRTHGPYDPHVWLDFGLDLLIADRIADALAALDPASAAGYRENAAALGQRLRGLDSRFAAGLKDCAGRRLIVAGHAAFGYLARRYGLVQTALYGLSPDAQPRPQQVIQVVELCRKTGIRTVFFENSVSPELARTLAAEIGGRVAVLYAGHALTRDQMRRGVGFFDLMDEDLKSLREGLGCR